MSLIGRPKKSFNIIAYNAQKRKHQMASFETWMEAVKAETGDDYDYYMDAPYSFEQAYEDGMKPSEAVADCRSWLEA